MSSRSRRWLGPDRHLHRLGLYFKSKGSNKNPADTDDAKQLANIAMQRWQSYQNVYVPAENQYIDEMRNFDKESRMEQMTRAASAGTRNSFAQAIDTDINNMTSAGINPASGTFQQAINHTGTKAAEAETANTTQTQQAIQDQKVQGLQNVVAIGMGKSGEAIAGLNTTAAMSAQKAEDKAINQFNNRTANTQAIGTAVGAGTRAAVEYGNKNGW